MTQAGSDRCGISGLALAWHRAGAQVAVATVVDTWGSAPRPVGSQLVIDEAGRMEGSVSGGCVEGAVIVEALEAMQDGAARLLDFGVTDDEAFAVGLACGGRIRVLVEPVGGALPLDLLEDLVAHRAAGRPVAYVADIEGEARAVAQVEAYPQRFRLDKSGVEPDGRSFVAIHNPPLRMAVVGGVHIAQHLVPMARACGFDVTLIDPRPAFGSPERFADTVISDDWPDEALAKLGAAKLGADGQGVDGQGVDGLGVDGRTAVVTLTHDPKLDDPAIIATLGTQAFYLGCLGSTRTHAKRLARLHAAGFDAADTARIHAPVGLDIGGRAPAEIAVSIMAQIIQVLRQG